MDPISERKIRGNRPPNGITFQIVPLDCTHLDPILEVAAFASYPPWNEKDFAYFLAHESGFCYGVKVQGQEKEPQIVAFLIALLTDGELDIASISTHGKWRRKGLGNSLLQFAENYPLVQEMVLEVDVKNEPAIGLYQKNGFKTTETRKAYYDKKQDAYRMLKRLER